MGTIKKVFGAATLVLTAIQSQSAMATIPDAGGVIHGCYSNIAGTARIIDNSLTSCRPSETAISWSVTGPPGSPGAPGSPGPQGPSNAFSTDNERTFSSTSLGPDYVVMLTLSLPAGDYVVNAIAGIAGGRAASPVQCAILKQSINFPVGVSVQSTPVVNRADVIPLVVAFTLDASDNVQLACRDSASEASTQPSAMTAIKVETLTKQ